METVLEWAAERSCRDPYGGGTSVVGGVEPRIPVTFGRRVVAGPRRARPGARDRHELARGRATAPARRARGWRSSSAPGLTMRCYPQSFELSTLGGWIATRAGGHFAVGRRRTSTTSSRPCGRSRRAAPGTSRRLPARALDPRPTGCCSARRGSSASSPRRGCACSPARRTGPGARCASAFDDGAEAVRGHRPVRPAARPTAALLDDWKRADRSRATARRDARAGVRVDRPRRRARPGPARSSSAAQHGGEPDEAEAGGREARARGARPSCAALPARHARPPGSSPTPSRPPSRGSACRPSTRPCRRDARGARRARPRDVPPDARLPRRRGALLHGPRAGAPRRRGSSSGSR